MDINGDRPESATRYMFDIFPKKLIFSILCFDLDETLIDHVGSNNKYIKDLNKKLTEYQDRGTKIIYASARNKNDTLSAVKKYSLFKPDYLITDLGVNVYEIGKTCKKLETKKFLKNNWDLEKVNNLMRSIDGITERKKSRSGPFKLTYYINSNRDIIIKNIKKKIKDNHLRVSILSSGNNSIYLIPTGFSKGRALERLVKKLKIDKNDVCVYGDSVADLSLFKTIKNSVLVGNAEDSLKNTVKDEYKDVYISKNNYSKGVFEGIMFLEKESHKELYKDFYYYHHLYENSDFGKIKNWALKKEKNKSLKYKIFNWLIISEILEKQGSFKDAKNLLKKTKRYLTKIFDLELQRVVEMQIARNSISLGELEVGIKILNSVYSNSQNDDFKKYLLNTLAYAYRVKGENNKAEKILKSIKITDTKTRLDLSVLHNLAGLYREQEKYKKSLDLYKRIIDKTEKNNQFSLARLYNNIGFIYRKIREYSLAEKYYLKSLKLEKKIGSKQLQGRTLNNLGGVNRMRKNLKKALTFFNRSVYIRSRIRDDSGLSSSLLNKGIVFMELGNKRGAKKYLEESYKIRKKIGSPKLINEVKVELDKI